MKLNWILKGHGNHQASDDVKVTINKRYNDLVVSFSVEKEAAKKAFGGKEFGTAAIAGDRIYFRGLDANEHGYSIYQPNSNSTRTYLRISDDGIIKWGKNNRSEFALLFDKEAGFYYIQGQSHV